MRRKRASVIPLPIGVETGFFLELLCCLLLELHEEADLFVVSEFERDVFGCVLLVVPEFC